MTQSNAGAASAGFRIDARATRPRVTSGLAALALGLLCACASVPRAAPPVEYPDYRVGAPDSLAVTILPEPAIVETAVVRPDGKITIQLVGDVQASGRTTREIADEIGKRIARFKRGAVVTVSLTEAASPLVTVLGEVERPGSFPLSREMRVSEALGSVGGVTTFANDDSVRVVRPGEPPEVIVVDMQAIRGGDLSTNVQLYSGDLVYVPPTIWARVGYVVQSILFPFQPLLGVANSAAGTVLVN